MATPSHISAILARIGRDERISESERLSLQEWMTSIEFETELIDYHQFLSQTNKIDQALAMFDQQLQTDKKPAVVHRVHFLKTAWFRYAAAIIILFGIGAYLWNNANESPTVTQTQPVSIKIDVKPGSDKAVLTLADGQQIALDSSANALLARQGIDNSDAVISYSDKGKTSVINTLATPKGGQYKIRLSDGTMVWLNAASSITYPTNFTASHRVVTVTGEVYFEVAKNKSKPFVVNTPSEKILVLGTSFNINAYTDEPSVKVSLAEGSIKINDKVLTPGQAFINNTIIATDISQDIAWKNGLFNFENVELGEVMRQLSRWYNLEVVYSSDVPKIKFVGEMTRNISLQSVLKILEGAGVQFALKGERTLIVQ